jgi:sulfur dioxygenase
MKMLFKQLFDQETGTYTYLIADKATKEAVLIDSVREQAERDAKLIQELGLTLKYFLETHIHADHVTAVSDLKKVFPQALSVVSAQGGAPCADILVHEGDEISFGAFTIKVLETPGHTDSCVSYVMNDRVFTGDALLIRGCGRTDFQQGSPERLYASVTQKLFTLPGETLVFPAHNYVGFTVSSIQEEKTLNPRLANTSEAEFIKIMNQLNLPKPKRIEEAVPANLNCGNPLESTLKQG